MDERKYLGQTGVEKLIENLKDLILTDLQEHNNDASAHSDIQDQIGSLSELSTESKESIVMAVNEIVSSVSQKTQVQFVTWEADD